MPRPEETGIPLDREREVRGTYIGGFPEPERAIQGGGAPEALRVLRRKFCCAEDRFGLIDCIVYYVYAGINAASQEVFSTCDNRLVCCMVIYICWYSCRISGGVLQDSGNHE